METILKVENLSTSFKTERGVMKAIDGVSFEVHKGEILGIVGESGCGKSVTSQSILRLYDEKYQVIYSGDIVFADKSILKISEKEMQDVRGNDIAMVFQDALSALNPVFTVGHQIMDTLKIHQGLKKKEAREKAIEMLRLVGIPDPQKRVDQYPHELSGGMRQRVMIAIALCCQPKLLIADEPTTALDVTIQAQILNLIRELQKELKMTVVYITHDLGVVANVADRVAVMYAGQIVEYGMVEEIFYDAWHPYTWALLSSLPQLGIKGEPLPTIEGTPPNLFNTIKGDAFAPRNKQALAIDFEEEPPFFEITETHQAKTWYLDPRAPKIEQPKAIKMLRQKMQGRG